MSVSATLFAGALTALLLISSCTRPSTTSESDVSQRGSTASDSCPARIHAYNRLPGVPAELETLQYWLAREDQAALDAPLMSAAALARHDQALAHGGEQEPRIVDLTRQPKREELVAMLQERLGAVRERFAQGDYQVEDPAVLRALEMRPQDFVREPELRVALSAIDLRCAPFEARIQSTQNNPRFDRNSCSQARAQEPIEILGRAPGHLRLARTRYSVGFIAEDAPLSPRIPRSLLSVYLGGVESQLLAPLTHAGHTVPAASFLPTADARRVWLAGPDGFTKSAELSPHAVRATARPLTRRRLLQEAFRYVGDRYGWGDEGGGRDCSRLLLDILQSFGLHIPRTSAAQSTAGVYAIEIPAEASEADRKGLLDVAQQRGVVLIHFPGHIMLYLGRDHTGVPRAFHALAEYLKPCPEGGETLYEVERVSVSDLTVGQGSSRGSFLERMTRLTVFGQPPGYELAAFSTFRPPLAPTPEETPSACGSREGAALFHSPRAPAAGQRLRVIAATSQDLRPATLWLIDPKGKPIAPQAHQLGVGPFGRFAEHTPQTAGVWTALLADGPKVHACDRFRVGPRRRAADSSGPSREPGSPAWPTRAGWGTNMENLYAVFVEQLFSHDLSDMRTWSSLTELLSNPDRNLLFNHLGLDEDQKLELKPDCADLPYFLRAYFAWKYELPFAFRRCSRGRANDPPRCQAPITNELPLDQVDPLAAFDAFIRTKVGWGVHSATVRTLPRDEASDLYPVALDREVLKPGTVFADPYGHIIVIAKWVPQGLAGAGLLLGADAQPDAAVGRRRFWQGNFLFTPDTHDVGAGFKAFRPVVRDRETEALVQLTNQDLRRPRHFPALSMDQYRGDQRSFYDRMDALIYPRPVAAADRMRQLVDALEEQVVRRIDAIDIGEEFIRTQPAPVDMPEGFAIFETQGPWEDFATPSRDMRLLIAMDVVRDFPAQVAAHPARFGLQEADAQQVQREMDQLLGSRRFAYTRSDGSRFELTLKDVMQRIESLEMGYNLNDCVERRWGAPEASSEAETCQRRAPKEQRARMNEYRRWFQTRTRPARP